jgi:hypothetical protein
MDYIKSFFCIITLCFTLHCSANFFAFRASLRVGYQAFKESLKSDLRPHMLKLEEKTINKSLSYDMQLRIAIEKKQALEKELAAEKYTITKLKLKTLLHSHASSLASYISKEWFSEKTKQISRRYFLTDGKKVVNKNDL